MPLKSLSSVAITVSNAKSSLAWYVQKLGFKEASNEGHWVTVSPPGSETVIHLCETKQLEPGNTGILFGVEDVDSTYKELTAKGVVFTKAPRDDGWGKYALFKDPDGNEFWIMKE
ncbi:MAG: VOC family protein [Thermoprotei archaeon]